MKKKQQITLHKNLQSGKTHHTQQRNINHFSSSHRPLLQKNFEKQSRKILSQQKIPSNKRSQSKNSSKESRQMSSSIAKNERGKSKKKSQSVKGSKKSLKRHNSEEQNSMVSGKVKNIYTKVQKPKKKKTKFSDRSESERLEQEPSITSITESIKSESSRMDVDQLVKDIQEHEFANLHKLKLHVLNFIFKNRIIRDEQYDRLFELLVQKFPEKEEVCKSILFQIVSSLDN